MVSEKNNSYILITDEKSGDVMLSLISTSSVPKPYVEVLKAIATAALKAQGERVDSYPCYEGESRSESTREGSTYKENE